MLTIPVKSKDLCGVTQAAIEISFEIIYESQYQSPAGIPTSLIKKLAKKRCLPGARTRNDKLLTTRRCKNAFHGIAEFFFYAVWHVLRHRCAAILEARLTFQFKILAPLRISIVQRSRAISPGSPAPSRTLPAWGHKAHAC